MQPREQTPGADATLTLAQVDERRRRDVRAHDITVASATLRGELDRGNDSRTAVTYVAEGDHSVGIGHCLA